MRNLRHRYTPEQRLEFQDVILSLRQYLLPLLLERQGNACDICHKPSDKYDIDHLIYNPMQTIDHLRALCKPCHKSVTNYTTYKNRNNPSQKKVHA